MARRIARTRRSAWAKPKPVSMRKCARRRFSESGICLPQYCLEFFLRHARSGEHTGSLHRFGRGDERYRIDLGLAPGLEQEWNVENDDRSAGMRRQEPVALLPDQRVDDPLPACAGAIRPQTAPSTVVRGRPCRR